MCLMPVLFASTLPVVAPVTMRTSISFLGRDQFAALYRAAGCHPHILDMHHGTNSEIDIVDDTHARAVWALEYRNINTLEKTVTFLSAVYYDE